MTKVETRFDPCVEDGGRFQLSLSVFLLITRNKLLCLGVDCHLKELLIPNHLGNKSPDV